MKFRKFSDAVSVVVCYCIMATIATCSVVLTASFMVAAAKFVLWVWAR